MRICFTLTVVAVDWCASITSRKGRPLATGFALGVFGDALLIVHDYLPDRGPDGRIYSDFPMSFHPTLRQRAPQADARRRSRRKRTCHFDNTRRAARRSPSASRRKFPEDSCCRPLAGKPGQCAEHDGNADDTAVKTCEPEHTSSLRHCFEADQSRPAQRAVANSAYIAEDALKTSN